MRKAALPLIFLLLALLVRLDFLIASNFRIDSDEAIVGLMAKHFLEGSRMPTFYYGQHYMGSFEALATAVLFSIFGVSVVTLKCVPLLFSLLFLYCLYLLATKLHSRNAGLLCLALAACPPAPLVIWSTKARGGFIELMLIGAASLLTTVQWSQKKADRLLYVIMTGLLLGFGWWVNNQIIYFMLPIGLCMILTLARQQRSLSSFFVTFLVGCISFVLGGLPFWLYNLEHDFVSFDMFGGAGGTVLIDHVQGFFSTAVPILLGAIRYWHTEEVFPGAVLFAWLLVVMMFLVLFFSRTDARVSRSEQSISLEILYYLLFAIAAVFIGSSFGYLSQAPRYLLPMYVAIPILFSVALIESWRRAKVVSAVLLAGWIVFVLASGYLPNRSIPGEPFVFKQQRASRDHSELIAWLKQNNYSWIRTNYWIGYRISFETLEQVRFLIFGEPHQTRIAMYQRAGEALGRDSMPLVLVPTQAEYVKKAFVAQGYLFKEKMLSGYSVLYAITPSQKDLIPIEGLQYDASHGKEFASLAGDRDLTTRWRTASPQVAGMAFHVSLPQPGVVRGISYALGEWPHDYPRELQIVLEFVDGSKKALYPNDAYVPVRYALQGDTTIAFFMFYEDVKAVHFLQTGSHSILDWSIAEVQIYR